VPSTAPFTATPTVAPDAPIFSTPWTAPLNPDPFAAAELSRISDLLANGNQPPPFLIPIYKAAGRRYHVPWKILAAINSIETDYGRDLNVSSAGATGWMQFMPATWRTYAVTADGHQRPNPYDPQDAIFTAARYLAANGAPQDLWRAIFAYNHASWYVEGVLLKAQAISDNAATSPHALDNILPLMSRNVHQLGSSGELGDTEVAAAYLWSQALDSYGRPYGTGTRQLTDPPPPAMDCSSSVSWVLWNAGMYMQEPGGASGPLGNAWTSGSYSNWGEPGPGKEMTVWVNPGAGPSGHVFIEFHIPGLPHMQLNTSGGGDGPRFFGWGGPGEADSGSATFFPRHWPGT
jgi:hypothetical protein